MSDTSFVQFGSKYTYLGEPAQSYAEEVDGTRDWHRIPLELKNTPFSLTKLVLGHQRRSKRQICYEHVWCAGQNLFWGTRLSVRSILNLDCLKTVSFSPFSLLMTFWPSLIVVKIAFNQAFWYLRYRYVDAILWSFVSHFQALSWVSADYQLDFI